MFSNENDKPLIDKEVFYKILSDMQSLYGQSLDKNLLYKQLLNKCNEQQLDSNDKETFYKQLSNLQLTEKELQEHQLINNQLSDREL